MRLDEYQWSRNPRGIHNKAAPQRMSIPRLVAARYGWCKMVSIGGEYTDDIEPMLTNGVTPIIRVFRHNWGAGIPDDEMRKAWRGYIERGVKWFELYNEPNLGNEWPGVIADSNNREGIIKPLMDNWLTWAESFIDQGLYPAFPALSEATGDGYEHSIRWLRAMFSYLADAQRDRFLRVANNGMWVATHPYTYNHFYQERAGSRTPRQPDEQRGFEGGWHFEYPYDAIAQASNPGVTTISGPAKYPDGDPIGLIAMGDAFMRLAGEYFGINQVPVVATEGGIWPVPKTTGDVLGLDARYPPVTWFSHGEATVAMYNWIINQAPPWMFGVTMWKEDDYYESAQGVVRAVQLLESFPPAAKVVPPIEVLPGGGPSGPILTGPGPLHGAPDYHFVLLAAGFSADWYFNVGGEYTEKFRPTMSTDPSYIAYLPYAKSLVITVMATPDMSEATFQQVKQRWPNVMIDSITVQTEAQLQQELTRRLGIGMPYGEVLR